MVIFYSLINPAKDLSKAMYSIQKGLASMERVDKILGAINPIQDPASPMEIKSLKGRITYDGVTFSYGTNEVIHDVSLDIPAGATVAWWGSRGRGNLLWPTLSRGSMMCRKGQSRLTVSMCVT